MDFTRLPEFLCLLVDNGSLDAAATSNLRKIAAQLERHIDSPVWPVSLLHSDRVPPADLDGKPAETLEPAMRAAIGQGMRNFAILPFFFGPSAALTDFVPERLAAIGQTCSDLNAKLAEPLVNLDRPEDNRIAKILADHVKSTVAQAGLADPPDVIVVDHGSPRAAVTDVRNRVAEQLAGALGTTAKSVSPASMERRHGSEYDFNEPLLDHALRQWAHETGGGDVVISMMFLSPGRHAGPMGDIERICLKAEQECQGLTTHITPLAGEHPLILEILADRFREITAR